MGSDAGGSKNPGRCIISPVAGINKPGLIVMVSVIFLRRSALRKTIWSWLYFSPKVYAYLIVS
jgi:hypothetical protein